MTGMTPWKMGLVLVSMLTLASACGDDGGRRMTTMDAGTTGDPDSGTGDPDSGRSEPDGGGGDPDAGCADDDGDGVCNDADACEGSDDAADADSDGEPDGCDACEGSDDAADADSDGVPDGCDVCEGSDDSADADTDGVPDGCDLCGEDGPRILLYQVSSSDTKGQAAVELLGCEVSTATGATFITEINSDSYDLVVFDAPNVLPSGAWQSALVAFIRGGGGAIIGTWTSGWASGVAGAMGVSLSTAHSEPVPIMATETDPIFEGPFDLSSGSFGVGTEDPGGNNGHILTRLDGAQYATFDPAGNAIIRSNGGRTFANGFLFDDYDDDGDADGTPDMVELIANQIVAVAQSIRNDMYALPYDYYEWDADGAALLARAIDFRWFETPWDEDEVVGMVSECADTTNDTEASTTPGGPYMGEYHATVAAAEHGGIDSARIVRFSTAAEADSAIGTYDVLVFTEAEAGVCTRNATTWRPIVGRHLNRGGRVVFTTPLGTNDDFVADLGRFGTGTGAADDTPFSTVADPFWTGITHPGVLDATAAWSWSGPGLETLGQDSNGNETVFRYITTAQVL